MHTCACSTPYIEPCAATHNRAHRSRQSRHQRGPQTKRPAAYGTDDTGDGPDTVESDAQPSAATCPPKGSTPCPHVQSGPGTSPCGQECQDVCQLPRIANCGSQSLRSLAPANSPPGADGGPTAVCLRGNWEPCQQACTPVQAEEQAWGGSRFPDIGSGGRLRASSSASSCWSSMDEEESSEGFDIKPGEANGGVHEMFPDGAQGARSDGFDGWVTTSGSATPDDQEHGQHMDTSSVAGEKM
eukprot:evm.model.scf_1067.4 EVM.evm.TU.scf_1067.4   scf_1067:43912-44637(+)